MINYLFLAEFQQTATKLDPICASNGTGLEMTADYLRDFGVHVSRFRGTVPGGLISDDISPWPYAHRPPALHQYYTNDKIHVISIYGREIANTSARNARAAIVCASLFQDPQINKSF